MEPRVLSSPAGEKCCLDLNMNNTFLGDCSAFTKYTLLLLSCRELGKKFDSTLTPG